MKIFIGCAPNHDDAESQAVLEYSIRSMASEPVEITWMKLSRDPTSPFFDWDTTMWATPFTGFRHAVPVLCGYEGRAIYLDSDVIVMADLAELWNRNIWTDVVAKAPERLCVSLWNCEKVERRTLDQLRRGEYPPYSVEHFGDDENWNCLDGECYKKLHDRRIKAIHYSSMPHQPHLKYAIKRLALFGRKHWFDGTIVDHWRPDLIAYFDELLIETELEGFRVESYCQDEPYGYVPKNTLASLSTNIPHWGRGRPCL